MAYYERDYYRGEGRGGPLGGARAWSITAWLIVICVVVYVLDGVLGGSRRGGSLAPSDWGNFNVRDGVYGFQFWRWGTYQFLHSGLLHILFNMLWLYYFGPMLEKHWGRARFLAFYLLSGFGGAALMTFFAIMIPDVIFDVQAMADREMVPGDVRLVGASGSILGVIVGAAMIAPKSRVGLLFLPVTFELRQVLWFMLGIAVFVLVVGGGNAGGEAAHLGGAIAGFILMKNPGLLGFVGGDFVKKLSPEHIKQQTKKGAFDRKMAKIREEEAEVDRILAKVSAEGLHSLTGKERKTLERDSERKRQQDR